jgi:hypothetical protein
MKIPENIEKGNVSKNDLPNLLNEKFGHLDDELTNIILKHSDIFNAGFVGEKGIEKRWVNSEDSVHQFFAASYILERKVKNNELDREDIQEVEQLFQNVAKNKRREAFESDDEELYMESKEIEILSDNVKTLVKIWKDLEI